MDIRGIASSSTIFITCFLLFFFTFASARYPFDSTGINIDYSNHDSFSVSDENNIVPADVNPNILLPFDKPDSTDSKSSEPKAETIESTELASNTDPFTIFSIPRHPLPLSFRLGHRCHHNHYYKPWKPRLRRREDDMEDNKDVAARGGVRQIPGGWMRFRPVEPMFLSRERSMAMERSELLRRLYNRRHDEPENKDTSGLMKRIRKFLKNF